MYLIFTDHDIPFLFSREHAEFQFRASLVYWLIALIHRL